MEVPTLRTLQRREARCAFRRRRRHGAAVVSTVRVAAPVCATDVPDLPQEPPVGGLHDRCATPYGAEVAAERRSASANLPGVFCESVSKPRETHLHSVPPREITDRFLPRRPYESEESRDPSLQGVLHLHILQRTDRRRPQLRDEHPAVLGMRGPSVRRLQGTERPKRFPSFATS